MGSKVINSLYMRHTQKKILVALLLLVGTGLSTPTFAAEDIEVAGWIPYWRDSEGIKDAKKHIEEIDTLYPFAFTVKSDGTLNDLAGLSDRDWKSLRKTAASEDVEVIPTVMWSSGEAIDMTLRNDAARKRHVKAIADMVKKGDFDGVDIDYEGKKSETILYFSLFLAQLKAELGDKTLSCTLEARTPPDSLYREGQVPKTINYANDYKTLNVICDRIVIMAYDQQRADLKANDARKGEPYAPVADPLWVEKVVNLALKSFPEEKVFLGIPTYGRHWAVTVAPDWYRDYRSIGALNRPDMLDVADDHDVTPSRNAAGEMSFTYLPDSTNSKVAKEIKRMSVSKKVSKGMKIAAQALAYANKTGKEVTINMGWYSDAEAVLDKIDLAKQYGLRGISLFKIDGEEDPEIWESLEDN
jgi:spore germination protein